MRPDRKKIEVVPEIIYLGSTVEFGHDLGCSEHAKTLYYNMVWAPERVVIV